MHPIWLLHNSGLVNFMSMNKNVTISIIFLVSLLSSCAPSKKTNKVNALSGPRHNTQKADIPTPLVKQEEHGIDKKTGLAAVLCANCLLSIDRKLFVEYAKLYAGAPYRYGSSEPEKGFDCSGLVYHVFRHFNVKSPRSSYNYENIGIEVNIADARPGDLILFTTASDTNRVGHMGIITDTQPSPSFIHASTSKGVIISSFSGYYQKHFVKVIQVLQ